MAFLDTFLTLAGSSLGAYFNYGMQQRGIDAMNKYNDPANQVERLKAAGLSPAIMYGSGIQGNTQSLLGNYQNSLGQDVAAAMSAGRQGELARSQAALFDSEKLKADAETAGIILENENMAKYLDDETKLRLVNLQAEYLLKNAQANAANASAQESIAHVHFYEIQGNEIKLLQDWKVKDYQSRLNLNGKLAEQAEALTKKLDQETANLLYYHNYIQPQELEKLKSECSEILSRAAEHQTKSTLNVVDTYLHSAQYQTEFSKAKNLDALTDVYKAQLKEISARAQQLVEQGKLNKAQAEYYIFRAQKEMQMAMLTAAQALMGAIK